MRKYGLYLFENPFIESDPEQLRSGFDLVKAYKNDSSINFTLMCAPWSKEHIIKLLNDFHIDMKCINISISEKTSIMTDVYLQLLHASEKTFFNSRELIKTNMNFCRKSKLFFYFICVLASPLLALDRVITSTFLVLDKVIIRVTRRNIFSKPRKFILNIKKLIISHLHNKCKSLMDDYEATHMAKTIMQHKAIDVWYYQSTSGGFPCYDKVSSVLLIEDFGLIDYPIHPDPDIILTEQDKARRVEKNIRQAKYFVTFSETMKWQILSNYTHISPDAVKVMVPAVESLDHLISIQGFADILTVRANLCKSLLGTALAKVVMNPHAGFFQGQSRRYIFYVGLGSLYENNLAILKAYHSLLKTRYIQYKLVIYVSNRHIPAIMHYVNRHHLASDVLCLGGISTRELAACYQLAALAISANSSNAKFSPIFAQALSVETPVLMANAEVTSEVIPVKQLQEAMLFDPYDWRTLTDKIVWALKHREQLLQWQKPVYDKLHTRSKSFSVDIIDICPATI